MIPSKCVVRYLILSPSQIHFLRFILEGYEGIGMITTIDPRLGLVRLSIAPGCEQEVDLILQAEGTQLGLRSVTSCPP